MKSNFGQIRHLTRELASIERLKMSHTFIIGKWCLHAGMFIFDRLIIKFAGIKDRRKSLKWFDYGNNHTADIGVT